MKGIFTGGDSARTFIYDVEKGDEKMQRKYLDEYHGKVYYVTQTGVEVTGAQIDNKMLDEKIIIDGTYGNGWLVSDENTQKILEAKKQLDLEREEEKVNRKKIETKTVIMTCECGKKLRLVNGAGECSCGYSTFDY